MQSKKTDVGEFKTEETMTREQIKILIERFMQGETSCKEEAFLSEYFKSGNVDEEFEEYAELFSAINSSAIDFTQSEKDEIINAVSHFEAERRSRVPLFLSVAAMIALIVGLIVIWQCNTIDTNVSSAKQEHTGSFVTESNNIQNKAVAQTEREEVQPVTTKMSKETAVSKAEPNNVLTLHRKENEETLQLANEIHEQESSDVNLASNKETFNIDSCIFITRPENREYTEEDIAKLKAKEREAYKKWVELQVALIEASSNVTADVK